MVATASVLDAQARFDRAHAELGDQQPELEAFLEELLDATGQIKCYGTAARTPSKQLKNKLGQAASIPNGFLTISFATEDAHDRAVEALVDQWAAKDGWQKAVSCVGIVFHGDSGWRLRTIVEWRESKFPKLVRERLFPDVDVRQALNSEIQPPTPALALPDLPATATAWVEATSEPHGGPGWELGRCLWSPARDAAGNDKYAIMREPQAGDIVLHFVDQPNGTRLISGWSRISGPANETEQEPPDPGVWKGRGRYYRIELQDHHRFNPAPSVQRLQEVAGDLIRREATTLDGEHYPFQPYGDGIRPRSGGYLSRSTRTLYEAIQGMFDESVDDSPEAFARVCKEFADALRAADIVYGDQHDAWVRTFVCSVAAKRFVILTGLSGSGKTQIALKFGEWLGRDRFRVVPVRPDWTGPDALLGYEDALVPAVDGRRAWSVPRTLEFILSALDDPASPYVLILDEMNLAHVERYFADVLSAIESRQEILPSLALEKGHWRATSNALRPLPDNLIVVGTVNVDETTYMFSPKVLDRANTLEFRVPTAALPADARSSRRPRACAPGPQELTRTLLAVASDDDWHREHSAAFGDRFVELIRGIHELLTDSGDEYGHRTFYEGVRLAAMLAAAGEATAEGTADIFVLQKVLPRLHGSRRKLEPVLQRLGAFCWSLERDRERAAGLDLADITVDKAKLPKSLTKIRRMLKALRENQFASFSD